MQKRGVARGAQRRVSFVPLAEQDPALWDAGMIDEAEVLLRRAGMRGRSAAINWKARCSRRMCIAARPVSRNWAEVVSLYDALFALSGSPVVAINRALAIAEVHGAEAGLDALPNRGGRSAAGRVSALLGGAGGAAGADRRHARRADAYEIAIGMERDPAVRRFLQERQASLTAEATKVMDPQ